MRKILLIASLILAYGIHSYGQEKIQNENEMNYSADQIVQLDSEKETIALIGNANLKTNVFEFQNADKIIIDKKRKEVFITGKVKITNLNGGKIQKESDLKKHHLRYKIGEYIAYVE